MNNFLLQPKLLQIELSSFCNALCLGCHRTDTKNYNRVKPWIPKNKIVSIDTILKLLDSNIMSSIEDLEFCGTIDEPTLHPDFLKILHIARSKKDYTICIHTNGGTRIANYWTKLSSMCQTYKDHLVLFNIDGLEDTNHIYRQNVKFDKVIENAKAFIDAGGRAQWQFLIFPWNKHQIDDAAKLSHKLGFKNFVVRQDGSHVSNEGLSTIMKLKRQNNIIPDNQVLKKNYKEIEREKIRCNSLSRSMYFLSCDSKLWPCCFLPNGFYMPNRINFLKKRITDNYGDDFNDLTKYSADEIIQHRFYKNDLTKSFNNDVHTGCEGKINRCADTCTVKQLEKIPIGKIEKYVA